MKLKILGTLLLIPISTIGLVSCSGATVTPPVVEPPVEPEVTPPTTIDKMVKLINKDNEWEWFKIKQVEYVELEVSDYIPTWGGSGIIYKIKLVNKNVDSIKYYDKLELGYKKYIDSYLNWKGINNDTKTKKRPIHLFNGQVQTCKQ